MRYCPFCKRLREITCAVCVCGALLFSGSDDLHSHSESKVPAPQRVIVVQATTSAASGTSTIVRGLSWGVPPST